MAPLALVFLLFLVVPLATIVVVSFCDYNTTQIIPAFLLQNYEELLLSPVTWRTYGQTLQFSVITWALTLVLGFTVAYFLAFHVRSPTWQMVLFLLCTIPFWTSNVIRMISWIPLLGRNGLVNMTLIAARPDRGAARVAAVLQLRRRAGLRAPLHAVHGGADLQLDDAHRPRLLEAARDAGASGWQTLWNVIVPLCKPGIVIGSIFVVTIVMGDFVTVRRDGRRPERLGRADDDEAMSLLQYPAAAANAVVLLLLVLFIVAAMMRLVDIRKEL